MYAEAAIKNSALEYDRLYTYRIPPDMSGLKPGSLVQVGFGGRRKTEAIIVDMIPEKNTSEGYEVKDIISAISCEAFLIPEMVRILKWMKQRYFCTYFDILRLMLPLSVPNRKKRMKTVYLDISRENAFELIRSNELDNIKYIKVIENLIENPFMPASELSAMTSVSGSVLKTLEKKGFISIRDRVYERIPQILSQEIADQRPQLNLDQVKVVAKLRPLIGTYSQQLIFGVTGSGKTEVYMSLVEEVMSRGQNSLILVPEISLTPQMVSLMVRRFGNSVTIIHSRLTPGERYDSWSKIQKGQVRIVVGARSAVFAPLEDIGLIVIDEEHDPSYKSETSPRYNTKDIAVKRAIANRALLVMGSATPLIESFYKARKNNALHMLPNRAAADRTPEILLVDMKEEIKQGNTSTLSRLLQKEMKEVLSRDEKVMLLLNRRGFNSVMLCRSCGSVYKCINCSAAMRYHKNPDRLTCHHCGYTVATDVCRYCGSSDLAGAGYGTQFVEDELKKTFPEVPVLRLDADTQGSGRTTDDIISDFRNKKAAILIGTQLVAKGHDIEEVTLSGILNADMTLSTDDFRASERTFSLITQVCGRSGRGRLNGKAVIQSLETDDYSITNAVANDYISFYNDEIKIRRMMGYPPFKIISVIELRSQDKELMDEKKNSIYDMVKETAAKCEVIGPYDPYLSILSGKHRVRLLLKSAKLSDMLDGLTGFESKYGKSIRRSGIIISIDIDPYQVLI
jgi:primosomal protein N' (replication factor Y) (superfamily II helicase)